MFNITNLTPVVNAATDLVAQIDLAAAETQIGGLGSIKSLGVAVLAGESFDAQHNAYIGNATKDGRTTIEATIASIESSVYLRGLSNASEEEAVVLTAAQKNSIALVSMAVTTGKEYGHSLDLSNEIRHSHHNMIIQDTAAYNTAASFNSSADVLAGESFEDISLTGTLGLNTIAAARQAKLSPLSEMFAPTVAVPPSKQSIALNVRLPLVQRAGKHALNGKDGINRNRKSVVQARYDSTILQNDSTMIQAVYRDTKDDSSTTEMLAPASEIKPRTIQHNESEVKVQPILSGKEVDLKGLN